MRFLAGMIRRHVDEALCRARYDKLDEGSFDQSPVAAPSATEQIEHALATAALPLSLRQLRRLCRMRMATLCAALTTLRTTGRVLKSSAGYRLALR